MPDWKDEVAKLDIADVAQKLGVQVAPGRRSPRLAICPFHDDSAPSLHLFQDDAPHYHCFACHAHGDTTELVKQKLGVDFPRALAWFAANYNIDVGKQSRRSGAGPDIRQRALAFLREQDDTRAVRALAQTRGFASDILTGAGVTAGPLESFLQSLGGDRAAQDEAVEAGLAYAADTDVPAGLRSTSLSPFVRGQALFIPLANLRGRLQGLMARPLVGGGPKYRFTARFRKSDILYRGDQVRRLIEAGTPAALDAASDRFDLFLAEGVFDALRLESCGLPAVAILGAALSDEQAKQIVELAELALEKGRVLRLHLFFDTDRAGRAGVADALPRLLKRAAEHEFLLDVVAFDGPDEAKADPDDLLKDHTPESALELVRSRLTPALDALAAISLGLPFGAAPAAIANLDAAGSIMLQNRLARRLQKLDWPRIWRNVEPQQTSLGVPGANLGVLDRAYSRLAEELGRRAGDPARALPEPFGSGGRSAEANLLHALVLARESADTREYPVDVAAWDRIDEGATAFLPALAAWLREAGPPRRPYLAHYEAKDSGAPRLKCGPCPEDAIQQQYVLSELLRVRAENRDVAEQIPAVRYWADQPSLVVTGDIRPRNAVSFAYQIDMRALEERPDRTRRRDMFRPFLDCWNSFIRHIGGRIERMRCDLIYIARLDIKSFYDNVPRHAVARILERALPDDDTLRLLNIADQFGSVDGDRKAELVRWLLDHSFGAEGRGYAYADPASGEASAREGGGLKGLPQGPVISSYLANAVLFDLDAVLDAQIRELDAEAAEADEGPCGGVYARYVDDIVIAARSPEALRALRSAVEAKLETLGLELNEKSEHLAPMTADDARNWVVERRGAGFVGYGDLDDQPAPASDLRTGWADIPSLDRRTALSVLHWSALDDPLETPREEFEALISKVAQAEALRPPDLAQIARRVLLRAALEAHEPLPVRDPGDPLARFLTHLRGLLGPLRLGGAVATGRIRTDDRAVAGALAGARDYLATLAGLERLVTGTPENNPTFSTQVQQAIARAKQDLLDWILADNLLARLEAALIAEDDLPAVRAELGAQLEIQRASLEERAARALRTAPRRDHMLAQPRIAHRDASEGPSRPGASVVRLGWLRTFCPEALAKEPVPNPDLSDARRLDELLHRIAAGAQVEGGRLAAPLETLPAPAFHDAIAHVAARDLGALAGLPADAAARVSMIFRALAGCTDDGHAAFADALPAFLSLADGPHRAAALGRRPRLIEAAISEKLLILPLPPLPNLPGLFGYDPARGRVHAVLTTSDLVASDVLPLGLDWVEEAPLGALPHWSAPLPENLGFLYDPVTQRRRVSDDPGTIADVFEGLYVRYRPRGGPTTALLHVFALIGPLDRHPGSPLEGYFALAWRVPRDEAERLIFERRGEGLVLQRAPHTGAELWRIGQAVSDLFAISDETEAEADDAGVMTDRHLLQARLKRTAFARLRGRWIQDAQVVAALATGTMPLALERIVRALRETAGDGEGVGPLALEFLLSGRAMGVRMRLGAAIDVAGGWARFLESVGARGLRTGDDDGLFADVAPRNGLARPARALTRAGDTIEAWARRTDDPRCAAALDATALGFEIAALRTDLRDMALAIVARLTPQARERLGRVRPDLAGFGGLGPALLVEPRFGQGQGPRRRGHDAEDTPWDYEPEWQARDLFVTLGEALGQRKAPGRAALDRISTAGWLTILSVMAGALDFEMEALVTESEAPARPAFFPLADPSMAAPLKNLAGALLGVAVGAAPVDPGLWPWEITPTLDVAVLREAIAEARNALAEVRAAAGISAVVDPAPLRSLVPGDQKVEFLTADGDRYELPWWRYALTAAANERIDRTETVAHGDRRLNPCSLLMDGADVLMVQVVSESLARVADLQDAGVAADAAPMPAASAADKGRVPAVTSEGQPDRAQDDAPEAAGRPDDPPPRPEQGPVETDAPAAASPPRPQAQGPGGGGPLRLWREHQDRSWRRRGMDAGLAASGYGRVAILQYDFIDSYYPEPRPRMVLDGNGLPESLRVDAGAVDYRLSFPEHRRRQVLSAVLSTCASLGVEALVLPEYSAHPETVNWIEQHCRERKYAISVWAGTFRQPPGFALTIADGRYQHVSDAEAPGVVARPMQTHLSVVFRESQTRTPIRFRGDDITDETPIFGQTLAEGVVQRQKKYPSIGMNEEFKPHRDPIHPLMEKSRSLLRIESFVSELVCSELFVFNGPLNWQSFAEHLSAASARYRVSGDNSVEAWMDRIVEDARHAALVFGGAGAYRPRRSLLFVTCSTTRDADYHYFAQSAYLASGIVTAFCNGSGKDATGGSCFVGQGGWETRNAGSAIPNPYHGAVPGILSNGEHRGALGRNENALIVADVRPDRTVEDKPRSQALGAPMKLVAHIPILEAQSSSAVEGSWSGAWFRPRRAAWVASNTPAQQLLDPGQHPQLLHSASSAAQIEIDTFVDRMRDVADAVQDAGSTLALDPGSRAHLIAAAVSLAGLFPNSPGMAQRAKALAVNLLVHPERLPCPALVDWLVVDLDVAAFEGHLRDLRDLAASQKTASVTAASLTPALQRAPWRWTPRETETSE